MPLLLHVENINRIYIAGKRLRKRLFERVVVIESETRNADDPDVSIIIRTKNEISSLPRLLEDISAQIYNGRIEIILVDTSSTDGTVEYAKNHGARLISIAQKDFTYPRSLNIGCEAAQYDYIVTLVGHSSLSNTMMLKCLTKWHGEADFGGVYGIPLLDNNASRYERLACAFWMWHRMHKPEIRQQSHEGMLAANCSIISRQAWRILGGYDEKYAGGGEDTALGRKMLEAGLKVIYEPAFTVFHSHGLGLVDGIRQIRHWKEVASPIPQPFNEMELLSRRPDLRKKDDKKLIDK